MAAAGDVGGGGEGVTEDIVRLCVLGGDRW
jgi:hypothetical protein